MVRLRKFAHASKGLVFLTALSGRFFIQLLQYLNMINCPYFIAFESDGNICIYVGKKHELCNT